MDFFFISFIDRILPVIPVTPLISLASHCTVSVSSSFPGSASRLDSSSAHSSLFSRTLLVYKPSTILYIACIWPSSSFDLSVAVWFAVVPLYLFAHNLVSRIRLPSVSRIHSLAQFVLHSIYHLVHRRECYRSLICTLIVSVNGLTSKTTGGFMTSTVSDLIGPACTPIGSSDLATT